MMIKRINNGKRIRNSKFEIIRIISMLMIILSHYTVHNGINNWELPLGSNRLILEAAAIGKIGVVLFMLISGWFLGGSKKTTLPKAVKLELQVLTYSLAIFAIYLLLGGVFSVKDTASSIMPISFGEYWFMTSYMIILLFSPFINKGLNALSRKQYKAFIILSVFLFIILRAATGEDLFAGELGQFVTFYAIGNYLKQYKDNIFSKRKTQIIALVSCATITLASIIVMDLIGTKYTAFAHHSNYLLVNAGSIFSLPIAVSLFCIFAYSKPYNNRGINIIASLTLGIYLIHDNPFVRNVIWTNIFHNVEFVNSPLLIPHMIGTVVAIFVVCGTIEIIRKNSLERLYSGFVTRQLGKIEAKIQKRLD